MFSAFMMRLPAILADISVQTGPTPTRLEAASAQGVLWQAAADRFLLEVPNVARYLVECGCRITVEPVSATSPVAIIHHLEMLPLAALIFQRGLLAIHGAAVQYGQKAIIIAGDSGSGKSTLVAALQQRGWPVLADELVIVGLDAQRQTLLHPIATGIALWPDSLKKLEIDPLPLGYADANRLGIPPAEHFNYRPLNLRSIYHLKVSSKGDIEPGARTVGARFREVGSLMYNSHVADALCDRARYMSCVTAIVQSVPIKALNRQKRVWSVSSLVDHIVNACEIT
jgi:hypothetical protein